MIPPPCSYCDSKARLVMEGDATYPFTSPLGPAWICRPCDAYIACYQGSEIPLGTLANASLRERRQQAQAALAVHWRAQSRSRSHLYSWLAQKLGVPRSKAHISLMDEAGCARVIGLCLEHPQ